MHRSIRRLATLLLICFGIIALDLTYWQVIRSEGLVYGPHNARLVEEEARTLRGSILDRSGQPLAQSRRLPDGTVERSYSDPTLAPVVGYFSSRYGASGLELSFARYLRGDIQANALDTMVGRLLHRPRVGADLHLTIDSRLQSVAVSAMGSDTGAVVALDPRTGAVLAMVSTPYFDPNRVEEDWEKLQSNPRKPLYNRAAQGLYTPGSIFKIVTATAALDLGLVDPDRSYPCTQDLVVEGFRVQNKNHPGLSRVNFLQDFAYSCNVTFAKVGLGLGTRPLPLGDEIPSPPPWSQGVDESRRLFLEYAHRFGMEEPLPFDIPTSPGRIGGQRLSPVELANSAFGQGGLQVTPLLMALGAATIANGGKMPEPYLVEEIIDPQGHPLQRRSARVLREVMSPETAAAMNRLMVASVREGYARTASIPGVEVGGKTGSAEVGSGQKTHSWFIGYAPAEAPVVAVAVIMENKGPGSDFAAPAGRKVMEAALGQ